MLLAFLSTAVIANGAYSGPAPRLVDAPLADYYDRALAAGKTEPHKGLAMLEILLVPAGTEVEVDYSGLPPQVADTFYRGVQRGFRLWQDALGADFPFRLVGNGYSNPVRVNFVDAMPGSSSNHKGEIRTTRKIQWNNRVHTVTFDATVTIVKFGYGRTFMDENDIAHVTAHELGHALGLGDVGGLDRIMGPVDVGRAFARLNPEEVDAVIAFRRMIRAQINRLSSN